MPDSFLQRALDTFSLSLAMLTHKRSRMIGCVVGVGSAFFLIHAQIGLLCGWINTTTGLITHAHADVWVMARNTPAFDYGTPIPRQRVYQVKSIPGVNSAEGMIVGWSFWQCSDGRNVSIQIVGLDKGLFTGPWKMSQGNVGTIFNPDCVIVDALYLKALGIGGVGEECEILGKRAVVSSISKNVRTFTASPFVFSSLSRAVQYDPKYNADQVTYVLARCGSGVTPKQLCKHIAKALPSVEVLTSKQFAIRTATYWMLGTGAGLTVIITAFLGLLVGAAITSQTLYAITQDHLENYAMLLALGFSREKLTLVVLWQSLLIGGGGVLTGCVLILPVMVLSSHTPIPVESTPAVFAGLVAVSVLSCVVASWVSVRSIFQLDPVTVFTG